MKAFIHVIRKDVGGLLDLLEGLLAFCGRWGWGREHVGQ